jgi:hypothetical protein
MKQRLEIVMYKSPKVNSQLQGLSHTVDVMDSLETNAVFLMFSCAKSSQRALQLLLEDVWVGDLDERGVWSNMTLIRSTTVLRHLS